MIGIVPNLRTHALHTDSEQNRLKFTAVTSLWSTEAIENVATFEKVESSKKLRQPELKLLGAGSSQER